MFTMSGQTLDEKFSDITSILFNDNRGDVQTLQDKNFATDSRHCVLIKGFNLKEQAPSPSLEKKEANEPKMSPLQVTQNLRPGMPNQMHTRGPVPNTQIPQPNVSQPNLVHPGPKSGTKILEDALSSTIPSVQQPVSRPITTTPTTLSQNNPSIIQQPLQQQPNFPQPNMPGQFANRMPGSMASMNPRMMGPGGQPPNSMSQPPMSSAQNMPSADQPNYPPNSTATSMPVSVGNPLNPNAILSDPIGTVSAAAMQQQQRKTIWQGNLEFKENKGPDQPKVIRSLICSATMQIGEGDVNTNNWPPNLSMQLIPQQWLTSLHNLFTKCRSVIFNFSKDDLESLKSLYKVMSAGYAGCIQFQNQGQGDKVMMLLYSNRKKQFMGVIPNDQGRFMTSIRQIIFKQKSMPPGAQPGQYPNPNMPTGPGMPAGPGQQGPGIPVATPGGMMPGGVDVNPTNPISQPNQPIGVQNVVPGSQDGGGVMVTNPMMGSAGNQTRLPVPSSQVQTTMGTIQRMPGKMVTSQGIQPGMTQGPGGQGIPGQPPMGQLQGQPQPGQGQPQPGQGQQPQGPGIPQTPERLSNLEQIQMLQNKLREAQRKEMEYNQLQTGMIGKFSNPVQRQQLQQGGGQQGMGPQPGSQMAPGQMSQPGMQHNNLGIRQLLMNQQQQQQQQQLRQQQQQQLMMQQQQRQRMPQSMAGGAMMPGAQPGGMPGAQQGGMQGAQPGGMQQPMGGGPQMGQPGGQQFMQDDFMNDVIGLN